MTTARQEKLLKFLTEEYIRTAKPVPSALLAKKTKLKASSATIRNDMLALEKQGFLAQKHTSGGRVPTDLAYRHYVELLLAGEGKFKPPEKDQKKILQVLIKNQYDPRKLNKEIAKVLSELTGDLVMAGVAQEAEFFKQGLMQLFKMPEFKEIENIFQLTSFFESFELMFQLIEREFFHKLGGPSGLPIQILIGRENPFRQMKDQTIMSTKYVLPGDVIGSLTLIGPNRMDYERNIGLIRYMIEQLNKLNT